MNVLCVEVVELQAPDMLYQGLSQTQKYVNSLSIEEVKKLFSKFGAVQEIVILPGLNSNTGFVKMGNVLQAYHAFKVLNERKLSDGRLQLKVSFLKDKLPERK